MDRVLAPRLRVGITALSGDFSRRVRFRSASHVWNCRSYWSRTPSLRERLGRIMVPMLVGMTERGPDSAGLAVVYGGRCRTAAQAQPVQRRARGRLADLLAALRRSFSAAASKSPRRQPRGAHDRGRSRGGGAGSAGNAPEVAVLSRRPLDRSVQGCGRAGRDRATATVRAD